MPHGLRLRFLKAFLSGTPVRFQTSATKRFGVFDIHKKETLAMPMRWFRSWSLNSFPVISLSEVLILHALKRWTSFPC